MYDPNQDPYAPPEQKQYGMDAAPAKQPPAQQAMPPQTTQPSSPFAPPQQQPNQFQMENQQQGMQQLAQLMGGMGNQLNQAVAGAQKSGSSSGGGGGLLSTIGSLFG